MLVCSERPGYEAIAWGYLCACMCWGRPGYKAIAWGYLCACMLGEAWVRGYSMGIFVCMYARRGLGTRL